MSKSFASLGLSVLSVTAVAASAACAFSAANQARMAPSHRPRVYISTCEKAAVAPRWFQIVCQYPGGGHCCGNGSIAEGLVYRHYGSAVATAIGAVRACLSGAVQNLRLCRGGIEPEDRISRGHLLPAIFRFSNVVRCLHVSFNFSGSSLPVYREWHLFYGKLSYKFAGHPWNTLSIAPRNEIDTFIQPTCRAVRLPRR